MLRLLLVLSLVTFSSTAWSREYNTDRPGSDFHSFNLHSADPGLCESACNGDSRCRAWTYVRPGVQGHTARCWLKHAVPAARPSDCCVSGVKGTGLFVSRWDKIAGPGGSWSTGWVPNVPRQICGHSHVGCACPGYNFCGEYGNGAETYWWPHGCHKPVWKIRCTSVPQR